MRTTAAQCMTEERSGCGSDEVLSVFASFERNLVQPQVYYLQALIPLCWGRCALQLAHSCSCCSRHTPC